MTDASHTDDHIAELPPLTILAADDVEQNLQLLGAIMARDGHDLVCARDGAEAVRLFLGGTFDLVMLDMHMPGTDGLEAARLIRRHERETASPSTPILALTASVLPEDRLAAHKAGMDGFAVKPIDVTALRQEMARVLRREAPAAAGGPTPEPSEIQPQSLVVVDWESAMQLWGTRERVAQAISSFSSGVFEQHPVLGAMPGSIDAHQMLSALHAVRGVAGNLGLRQVALMASDLEAKWKALPPGRPGPSIDALREALREVQRHVEAEGEIASTRTVRASFTGEFAAVGIPGHSGEHAMPGPLSTDAVVDGIERLRIILRRSEVDDTTLDLLCRHADGTALAPIAVRLRSAVDAFDFARAESELDAYARVIQVPTERVA